MRVISLRWGFLPAFLDSLDLSATLAPIEAQAVQLAIATARKQKRPDLANLPYGEFEVRVKHNSDFTTKTRDRLAFVCVTGQF